MGGDWEVAKIFQHIKEIAQLELLFEVVPIYDALPTFGKEKSILKKAGNLIPDFDLLIGVTSIYHRMILVTNNTKHLSRISGISIENWVV